MFMNLLAPPVPPPAHVGEIKTLATMFFISGLLIALAVLPPVRHAVKNALSRFTEFFYGPPSVEVASQLPVPAEPATKPDRREITEFPYDLLK